MKQFEFSYDPESDDLFVHINEKSAGAIELGNFILDFDEKGNLVAMEIMNASDVFSKILENVFDINSLKKIQIDLVNFRNIDAIKFKISTDKFEETSNILIPHIREKSPVLSLE